MRLAHTPRTLVIGPYEVQAPIGAGSSGQVYRATDSRTGQQVAIKLLRTERAEDPTQRARFRREVAFLGTHRDHPNILHFVGSGEHDGQPYFVTEFIPGGSLHQRMRAGFRPTRVQSIDICVQVLSGLAELHRHRVVHRDVKPSNMLLRADGYVVLGDFGVALHERLASITLHDCPLGTLGYCAPEQRESPHGVGPAADLFSVGAVLYRLITRQPPPDLSLSQFSPVMLEVLPEPFRPIVARATRYAVDERYADAREMVDDLCSVRAALEQAADPAGEDVGPHEPVVLHSFLPELSF